MKKKGLIEKSSALPNSYGIAIGYQSQFMNQQVMHMNQGMPDLYAQAQYFQQQQQFQQPTQFIKEEAMLPIQHEQAQALNQTYNSFLQTSQNDSTGGDLDYMEEQSQRLTLGGQDYNQEPIMYTQQEEHMFTTMQDQPSRMAGFQNLNKSGKAKFQLKATTIQKRSITPHLQGTNQRITGGDAYSQFDQKQLTPQNLNEQNIHSGNFGLAPFNNIKGQSCSQSQQPLMHNSLQQTHTNTWSKDQQQQPRNIFFGHPQTSTAVIHPQNNQSLISKTSTHSNFINPEGGIQGLTIQSGDSPAVFHISNIGDRNSYMNDAMQMSSGHFGTLKSSNGFNSNYKQQSGSGSRNFQFTNMIVNMGCSSNHQSMACGGTQMSDNSKKSNNPKKLMNDSLNMISKTRNKLLNKSFQNIGSNSSGSKVFQNGKGSTGQNSIKFGSTSNFNQMTVQQHNMSLRKQEEGCDSIKDRESSLKTNKGNTTQIIDSFDQSYGKMMHHSGYDGGSFLLQAPRNNHNNIKISRTPILNSGMMSGNTGTMKSGEIGDLQRNMTLNQISTVSKGISERQVISSTSINKVNRIISQKNTVVAGESGKPNTSKQSKVSVKDNHQISTKSTGMLNTPHCKNLLLQNQQIPLSRNPELASISQTIDVLESSEAVPLQGLAPEMFMTISHAHPNIKQANTKQIFKSSSRISPISSFPKRQLQFKARKAKQFLESTNNSIRVDTNPVTNINNSRKITQSSSANNRKAKLLQNMSLNTSTNHNISKQTPLIQGNNNPEQHNHTQQHLLILDTAMHQQPPLFYIKNNQFQQSNPCIGLQAGANFNLHIGCGGDTTSTSKQSMYSLVAREQQAAQSANSTAHFQQRKIFKLPQANNIGRNMVQDFTNNTPISQSQLGFVSTQLLDSQDQQNNSRHGNHHHHRLVLMKRALTPSNGHYYFPPNTKEEDVAPSEFFSSQQHRKNIADEDASTLYAAHRAATDSRQRMFGGVDSQMDLISLGPNGSRMSKQQAMNNSMQHHHANDISFNLDCSQAFLQQQQHHINQLYASQNRSSFSERPMLESQIAQMSNQMIPIGIILQGPSQTPQNILQTVMGGQSQLQYFGNVNNGMPNVKAIADTPEYQSENLETSRFSSTIQDSHPMTTTTISAKPLPGQEQQNPQIDDTGNASANVFEYDQSKVKPVDTGLIKKAVMKHLNSKHQQQFFLGKLKSDGKQINLKTEQQQQAKEYLRKLKLEIEERKDQQLQRKEKLLQNEKIGMFNTVDHSASQLLQTQQPIESHSLAKTMSSKKGKSSQKVKQIIEDEDSTPVLKSGEGVGFQISPGQMLYYQSTSLKKQQNFLQQQRLPIIPYREETQEVSAKGHFLRRNTLPQNTQNCNNDITSSSSDLEQSQEQQSRLLERTETEIEGHSSSEESKERESENEQQINSQEKSHSDKKPLLQGKLNKDQFGRYHIRFRKRGKPQHHQLYDFEGNPTADATYGQESQQHLNPQKRKRRQRSKGDNDCLQNQCQEQMQHLMVKVPHIKRNMTPDHNLHTVSNINKSSYMLLDGFGQPRKITIKRSNNSNNKAVTSQSPPKRSHTLNDDDYVDDYNETSVAFNKQPFQTLQHHHAGKQANIQRKNFILGANDSSLLCCLSTKSQKQPPLSQEKAINNKLKARSEKSQEPDATSHNSSRCALQ